MATSRGCGYHPLTVKLSTRSEYACLAIIDLAQNQGDGVCTIHDISARRSIPRKYLEQILLTLKRSGYLTSKMGAGGGYRLARPAGQITLAEVTALMREIRDYISDKLEKTTFADMA